MDTQDVVLEESKDVKATSDVVETPWKSMSNSEIKEIQPEDIEVKLEVLQHSIDIKAESPLDCEIDLEAQLKQFVVYRNEKPFRCGTCDFTSSKKRQLTEHAIKCHPEGEVFECYHCDYKCVVKKSLQNHMKKHSGEKPFVCKICALIFYRRENLDLHVRLNHSGG